MELRVLQYFLLAARLDEIHFRERRLDRLDYLRHQIRKKSEKGT